MKESMSGILYQYKEVKNYYDKSDKWLLSIYKNPIVIKDDINLGLVAKEFGNIIGVNSGGHPKSSGISITMENKLSLFKNLFGMEFENV